MPTDKKFDVIIVLAGGITAHSTLPKSVLQRVLLAVSLFKSGCAPKVLMSGCWSRYWEQSPPPLTESELMRQFAVTLGMPEKSILKEEYSHNTDENAFYSKKLFLEPNNWRRVLVVTSSFHAKRAVRVFRRELGEDYQVASVGASMEGGVLKKFQWYLKETVVLGSQWFIDNFFNRR